MEYRPLGDTGFQVSSLCLGTMTWGEQNSEAEAFEQLDRARAAGINFIDAAEMYPVPPRAATFGRTEQILGKWLASRGCRDEVVLATKISGPGLDTVPDGPRDFSPGQLRRAVEGSLKRLQTDRIDLYQLHWPERPANYFGRLDYTPETPQRDEGQRLEETLETLDRLMQEGLIRSIGVSNETAWGVMRLLAAAERRGLPRVAAVQNPYNLLNRSYEIGLAEVSHRERCGLLAYSPLGFGVLTGKYLQGRRPAGARLTLFERFQRYTKPRGRNATARYVELARAHGVDPAQMAIAFAASRPFCTSAIIGATTQEQLAANLAAGDLVLDDELLEAIDAVHAEDPNPCP